MVLHEIDFDNTYTVDVDGLSLSPDPTGLANKDNAFINLICLKSSCVILSSEVRTHGLNAIKMSDGPSSIDMTGIAKNIEVSSKDISARYDHAVMQYKAGGSIAGQAILGPYSPGADNISRTELSSREGYFS